MICRALAWLCGDRRTRDSQNEHDQLFAEGFGFHSIRVCLQKVKPPVHRQLVQGARTTPAGDCLTREVQLAQWQRTHQGTLQYRWIWASKRQNFVESLIWASRLGCVMPKGRSIESNHKSGYRFFLTRSINPASKYTGIRCFDGNGLPGGSGPVVKGGPLLPTRSLRCSWSANEAVAQQEHHSNKPPQRRRGESAAPGNRRFSMLSSNPG